MRIRHATIDRIHKRQQRAIAVATGLCGVCCKREHEPERYRCGVCREKLQRTRASSSGRTVDGGSIPPA